MKLTVKTISNKSTKWETTARAVALEAAMCSDDFDGFVRYFTSVLKDRKRETTAHISDSYKAEKTEYLGKKVVLINHTPAQTNKRIIAIVYGEEAV